MNDLAAQLKSLGLDLGEEKKISPNCDRTDLTKVLGGEWIETSYGNTLHIKQTFPIQVQAMQGDVPLRCTRIDSGIFAFYQHDPLLKETKISLNQICFFDTETSSLNLGAGTFIFLCGFCHFEENGCITLDQFFLPHPDEEKAFLSTLQNFLASFSILATYNGKSFDIPLLRSRFIINDIENDSLEKMNLDLLFLVRALWKKQLPSCRLSEVEQSLLHFQRGIEEVPSWFIPILYQDYLREGDAPPLKKVLYHNAQDVLSLVALFNLLQNVFNKNAEFITSSPNDYATIAILYEKVGEHQQAERYYQIYFSLTKDRAKPEVMYAYAWHQRRKENWAEAVQYWSLAAEKDHLPSIIELSKYYEHQVKDIKQALYWFNKVTVHDTDLLTLLKDDIEKRKNRLERKSAINDKNRGF